MSRPGLHRPGRQHGKDRGDLIAECALLAFGAHVYGTHDAHVLALSRLSAGGQIARDTFRHNCQHHVVDRAAKPAPDLAYLR